MSRAIAMVASAVVVVLVLAPSVPAVEIAADYSGLRSDGVMTHGFAIGFGLPKSSGVLEQEEPVAFSGVSVRAADGRDLYHAERQPAARPWPRVTTASSCAWPALPRACPSPMRAST